MEGFVADPDVRVLIDTSLMDRVYYDAHMGAIAVEAGATLGEMYRKLALGWGVTVPAGISPDIGVGGHILGGAFGFLCRQYGLAADHLYGVEVVHVDQSGAGWGNPQDGARCLDWVRQFYAELFADTGGVPVPNQATGGAFINHPDADLADPHWNTSGVPWYTLYYQDNYPRLQQAKARWDPLNIFHHALSIRPKES